MAAESAHGADEARSLENDVFCGASGCAGALRGEGLAKCGGDQRSCRIRSRALREACPTDCPRCRRCLKWWMKRGTYVSRRPTLRR